MNYYEYLSEEEETEALAQKKKKQQEQLIILLLLGLGAYYLFVYLPKEEEKKKKTQQATQNVDNRTPEQVKEELEVDAWEKGRIWELPVHSWADRIVNSKKSPLLGEYTKFAALFPNGDNHHDFSFSRAAPYKIFFPPSLREHCEKGERLGLENCKMLENEKELILSDEINSWIRRAENDPTRGNYEKGLGNNALFYGAPGTGKTETMRNLCFKANKYPLVVVAGSDLTPTESDQSAEILPLHKFAYTISELEWSLVKDYGFEREDSGEVRYMLFVDEANQVSNNSLIFQPNELKFLKDCLESADKDRDSKNLWAFATNHQDQVEKATFRKGRLSNPLDFTWNWKVFKDFCEKNNVELPERWKKQNSLTSEDEKWLAEFNIDVFDRYFLGKDEDVEERVKFWELFIDNNPDAIIKTEIMKLDEAGNETEEVEDTEEKEIEIGEFLEFFWYVKKKYSTSFNGDYKDPKEITVKEVLDVRLIELIETLDEKLNEIRREISEKITSGSELIKDGLDRIIESLAGGR